MPKKGSAPQSLLTRSELEARHLINHDLQCSSLALGLQVAGKHPQLLHWTSTQVSSICRATAELHEDTQRLSAGSEGNSISKGRIESCWDDGDALPCIEA